MKHNPTRQLMQLLMANARSRGAMDPAEPDDPALEPEEPEIEVVQADDGPHLYLFGCIDSWWGVSAEDLIEALVPYRGQDVHLHINSPGGDVFEGRTMAAAVVAHNGKVHCHIDGLCASASTYPALACNTVEMSQGAMFMVHEGWTMGWGNKRELRKTADLLEQIDADIVADYVKHSNATEAQVVAWMEAETWFKADQALAAGFVDAVASNTKREALADNRVAARSLNTARWNLSAYAHAPQLQAPAAPDPNKVLEDSIADQLQRNRNRVRLLTV